ncbi:MAG: family 16 glycosylhydrolase [Oscillospiraceae bacterium]|nr:family 16 glycosylhydrolase [Oscillospiraceae bacterium]
MTQINKKLIKTIMCYVLVILLAVCGLPSGSCTSTAVCAAPATFKPYFMEGGDAAFRNDSERCQISVSNTGDKPYSVMAVLEGVSIQPSQSCSLDFSVSSSCARDIEVTVEDTSYNRIFDEIIYVDTAKSDFHFEVGSSVAGIYDIKFQMGKTAGAPLQEHTICISDFSWNNEITQEDEQMTVSEDTQKNWILDWSDEFDSPELDLSKWSYDIGNWMLNDDGSYKTNGWGNNEQQFYTDTNTQISDGVLRIFAKKENYTDSIQGNYDYTSAKITTKNKFSTCYGKVEVKARVDSGKSLWPAIWMLPEDKVYGEWASSGEIDIMEGYGSRPQEICGTIHFGDTWPANKYLTNNYFFEDNDSTENWHTYSIEWDENSIKWYIDDTLYSTQTQWYCAGRAFPAPFDQNFYIILNLAVGGNFDGVDGFHADPGIFDNGPKEMDIDYVRVYHDNSVIHIPGELKCETLTPYIENAQAQISNADSGCSVKITDTGINEYSVMAYLKNKQVEPDAQYCLDFDIISSAERNIILTAENTEYKRYFEEKLSVGTQSRHFHYDMKFEAENSIDIKFQMGNVDDAAKTGAHNILISNIKWAKKEESTQETLYGDADLNSVVDMSDMTLISLYCLGDKKLEGQAFINADVIIDNQVMLNDLCMMKQYIMKENIVLGVKI